jgi:hypothetical protein
MILFKALFWLIALPFRIVFWVVGLVLWVLTLPLRIVFGILGFLGFARLFQLAFLAAAGYYVYRLINQNSQGGQNEMPPPASEAALKSYPST